MQTVSAAEQPIFQSNGVFVTNQRVVAGAASFPLAAISATDVEPAKRRWAWIVAAVFGTLMLLRAFEVLAATGMSGEALPRVGMQLIMGVALIAAGIRGITQRALAVVVTTPDGKFTVATIADRPAAQELAGAVDDARRGV